MQPSLLLNLTKALICVMALAVMQPGALAQSSGDLAKAEQLIRNGRSTEAYELLEPQQFANAGDADFDYLLGLSALESGHADLATLAFERVLAVAPNYAAARLDMGRAYFALGDFPRARREFALARVLNPPPTARATMDRYEAEMIAKERSDTTQITGYIEAGLGNDGNATQGPNSNSLFLPAFGVSFTMNTANQKTADDFGQGNIGIEINRKISDRTSVYAGVDTKWRGYSRLLTLDSGNTDLRFGLQTQNGADTWRGGLGYNDYNLNGQSYRAITSLGGEFRRASNERRQWMLFGQYSELRYLQAAQINNDVNQWTAGGGWAAQLETSMPTMVSLSGYGGQEIEAKVSHPRVDGDKNYLGLRLGAQWGLRPTIDVYGSLGVQSAEYQRRNILYGKKRSDTLLETAFGGVWRFAPAWSMKPQLSWLYNSSNLSVYDYDRYEFSVFVRRDFQ